MSWVDCPMTRPRAELNPACTTSHTPTDIRLNVVPDIAEGPWVEKFAMGMAVPIPPPRHGQFAYISYARAKTVLLEAPQLSLGQLLGTPALRTRSAICCWAPNQSLPLGPDERTLEYSGTEARSAWTTHLLNRPSRGHSRRRSSASSPAGNDGVGTDGFSEVT